MFVGTSVALVWFLVIELTQGRTMDSYQFLEFAKTCKIPSKECSTAKLDLIFIKVSQTKQAADRKEDDAFVSIFFFFARSSSLIILFCPFFF